MGRWLAYSGSPVRLADALYSPAHALVAQRGETGSRDGDSDGYGVGWYGDGPEPAVFRGIQPAWRDPNLRAMAAHITSPLVLAHIRAAGATAVQTTNCHPFRHGRWLWMHGGLVADFDRLKRDLMLDVDPSLFPAIRGQTDSEVLFHLALTLGLEDDPPAAVAGAVGLVEAAARRRGVEHPMEATVATTDGRRLWVFRYASEGRSPCPPVRLRQLSDATWLVVSEPLGRRTGMWNELPESTYGVIAGDRVEILPFVPPRTSRAQRPAHVAGSWPA